MFMDSLLIFAAVNSINARCQRKTSRRRGQDGVAVHYEGAGIAGVQPLARHTRMLGSKLSSA